MAHFNTTLNRQHSPAVRRGIALDHISDVDNAGGLWQITSPVHSAEMVIPLIRARHKIAHLRNCSISDHAYRSLQIHGAKIAGLTAKVMINLVHISKTKALIETLDFSDFHFI